MEQVRTGIHKWGLSGSTLKMIAILTMLIDHIGAAVVYRMLLLLRQGGLDATGWPDFLTEFAYSEKLYSIYWMMRYIGRIAFPIFCFLLVVGFEHTRNKNKYGFRLFLFALISELPFDLAICSGINWRYQNVFFTLFLGYLTMIAIQFVETCAAGKAWQQMLGTAAAVFAGMELANLLYTDYSGWGVFCIAILYLFRKRKWIQIAAGSLSFLYELTAPLAFVPVALYNGKRGWKIKYFFYLFYPLHLLLLYLVCWRLGIAGISTV